MKIVQIAIRKYFWTLDYLGHFPFNVITMEINIFSKATGSITKNVCFMYFVYW